MVGLRLAAHQKKLGWQSSLDQNVFKFLEIRGRVNPGAARYILQERLFDRRQFDRQCHRSTSGGNRYAGVRQCGILALNVWMNVTITYFPVGIQTQDVSGT